MKKNFVLATLVMLSACGSNEPAKTETTKTEPAKSEAAAMPKEINSPYAILYSSKFEIDDPKNAESLLTLWKDWDNGNPGAHKDLFADTLEMHLYDGSMIHTTRDSALAAAQSMRNALAASESTIDAIMAVKSTDKNEHWALVWGMEKDTNKKGKVDSFYLQETWRFNKDGKTDLFYQYRQAAPRPTKK